MTIKVSDPALLDDLQSVTDAVELTTPEGKVIGTFKPAAGAFHPPVSNHPFHAKRSKNESGPLRAGHLRIS